MMLVMHVHWPNFQPPRLEFICSVEPRRPRQEHTQFYQPCEKSVYVGVQIFATDRAIRLMSTPSVDCYGCLSGSSRYSMGVRGMPVLERIGVGSKDPSR